MTISFKKGDLFLHGYLIVMFYLFAGNILSVFSFEVPFRKYVRLLLGVAGIAMVLYYEKP